MSIGQHKSNFNIGVGSDFMDSENTRSKVDRLHGY